MRAAIVEGEDASAGLYDEDRAMAAAHEQPPLGLKLGEAAGMDEIGSRSVHGRHFSAKRPEDASGSNRFRQFAAGEAGCQ
jgi:hypothetical protein